MTMETNLHVRNFDSPLSAEVFDKIRRVPVYAVLDNLRSAFNVGSIVRTADSALLKTLYMCGYTAAPPHKKLEKTALGALEYVPCEYRKTTLEAVEELKSQGIKTVAMETTNQSKLLWEYDFDLPVALILGNEALGVSEDVLNVVDDIVEIPMLGFKNSINVAVAFGIVISEIQRQHWEQYPKESLVTLLEEKNSVKTL